MRAISLFSGAGGMDLGFVYAGYEILAACELDPHAIATYRENHSSSKLFEGDIEKHKNELAALRGVDVVFGGPPCQGFSVAGKMNPDDPRSRLIFTFAELVEQIQPQAFVMENVKALGKLEKFSQIRDRLIARFRQAGYSVQIHILNAKDFGVPQARERVFFIGTRAGTQQVLPQAFNKYQRVAPTLREVIAPLGKPGSLRNEKVCAAKITLAAKPVLRRSPYAGMLFNGQGRPLNPDGWANTLPASMGGNRTPIIDEKHLYDQEPSWVESYHHHLINGGRPQGMHEVPSYLRRLTINEAAILQGFPENYKFCGPSSKVYSQIGNAVPCDLAYVVASAVLSALCGKNTASVEDIPKGENLELALF
jgi:DNA (cytosine-5)-methyltransferase 1